MARVDSARALGEQVCRYDFAARAARRIQTSNVAGANAHRDDMDEANQLNKRSLERRRPHTDPGVPRPTKPEQTKTHNGNTHTPNAHRQQLQKSV